MKTTYELNNIRRDADAFSGKFHKASPVVEVFSAMVRGESLDKFGAKADAAVAYIKGHNKFLIRYIPRKSVLKIIPYSSYKESNLLWHI